MSNLKSESNDNFPEACHDHMATELTVAAPSERCDKQIGPWQLQGQ